MPEPNEKTHSSIKLFHMIKELEKEFEAWKTEDYCEQENSKRIEVLEKHGHKNIYNLALEADANTNRLDKEFLELKDKPCMKLTQRNINCIERNRLRVDELKVFRHHVAMPRIITNEEVLREHLKSHKRVSQDQLNPAIVREELFKWFDAEIKKQLKKLDNTDSTSSCSICDDTGVNIHREREHHWAAWKDVSYPCQCQKEPTPSKYPNPKDCLVCRGEVPTNQEEYENALLYHKLRCEKEPTETYNPYEAKSILLEPYEIVVKKIDLEFLFHFALEYNDYETIEKLKTMKEKYLTEPEK